MAPEARPRIEARAQGGGGLKAARFVHFVALPKKKGGEFLLRPGSFQSGVGLVEVNRGAAVLWFFYAVAGLNHEFRFALA